MEVVIFLLIISCLLNVFLLVVHSEYRSTLKSKKLYDDIAELTEAERKMMKEDRVTLNKTIKSNEIEMTELRLKIFREQDTTRQYQSKMMDNNNYLENFSKKYINLRIENLKLLNIVVENDTEIIYKLQDILTSKKNHKITIEKFVLEIDQLFDKLQNTKP